MRRLACLAAVLLLLTTALVAQSRNLKVLVLYDMEGVSRATDARHTNYGYATEYKVGREALTDDVNAAIAGLKRAGVGDIVVVDGHGSGNSVEPDVIESRLLAPAKMIARDAAFDIYMDSYDHSAIEKLEAARPFEVVGPYRFAITFGTDAMATHAELLAGAEPGPVTNSVQVRANDFEEGYRRSIRLYSLAGFAVRLATVNAAVADAPNAADLRQRMLDWSNDRFLYRPLPAAPALAPPVRFWGAR